MDEKDRLKQIEFNRNLDDEQDKYLELMNKMLQLSRYNNYVGTPSAVEEKIDPMTLLDLTLLDVFAIAVIIGHGSDVYITDVFSKAKKIMQERKKFI